MIKPYAPLLAPEILERAKQLEVTQICDGMTQAGFAGGGSMAAGIRAVHPSMRVTGTAVTVETSNGDNLPIHLASYTLPNDGYVMVIDGKGYEKCAYFGDLIIAAAQCCGYIGMIIDGYSRDYEGNLALGFPVFSRGMMPAGPIKKDSGVINGTILCGGITVNAGDLVVGDSDGVCVVPRDQIDQVLTYAEKKRDYEAGREVTIAAYRKAKAEGSPLPQLAPQWVLDMTQKTE